MSLWAYIASVEIRFERTSPRSFIGRIWDGLAYRRFFSVAGHLARMVLYDPERPIYRILNWKDYALLLEMIEKLRVDSCTDAT